MLIATEEHLTGGGVGGGIVATLYLGYTLWRQFRTGRDSDAKARIENDKLGLAVEEKAVEVGGKRLALEEQIGQTIARTYTDLMAALRSSHDAEMKAVTDRLTALEERENRCQEALTQVRRDNEALRKQDEARQSAFDSLKARLRELEEQLKLSLDERVALRDALQQLRTQLQRSGAIAPGSGERPALPAPAPQPLRAE